MRKTTLGEQGQKLPIGVRNGRAFNKDFTLRPYKSFIDRHLGDWDEAAEGKYKAGAKVAARIPKFLSLICESFGGVAMPLDDKRNSPAESELKFWGYTYADVMYAYIYSRLATLGPDLEVRFTCQNPKCKVQQRAVFDLRTLEVDVLEEGDEYESWVVLKEPIKLRDGKLARKVRVHPVLWSSLMQPGVFSGLMSQVSFSALAGCIAGVDAVEGAYQLIPSELDEIGRQDVININRKAGLLAAGIDLETSVDCAACKTTHKDPLNWTFDFFFGSSLPISETANS